MGKKTKPAGAAPLATDSTSNPADTTTAPPPAMTAPESAGATTEPRERKAKAKAKAKRASGFTVTHGGIYVGPNLLRTKGQTIEEGELSKFDRDRLLADKSIERRS